LGKKEGELPITPGMQTTVDIHTGKRTVLDLVVLPVLKASSEMFRER
jgi:adhesin transport system membrane fusion protein